MSALAFCDRCGNRTDGREASVGLGERDRGNQGVPYVQRELCRGCADVIRQAIGPKVAPGEFADG